MSKIFYEGSVLWATDHEIKSMDFTEKVLARQISFVRPLAEHEGKIYLTDDAIIIDGDKEMLIGFFEITEIYHGFDNVFTVASAKNFGLSWQPIRITYANERYIYLIIDYNYLTTGNVKFFNLLKELLGQ